MKVVKADEVLEPQIVNQSEKKIDKKLVAELTEKFDSLRQVVETKKYGVALSKEQTSFMFDEFYQNVEWKGYESYAIAETHKKLSEIVKNGETNGTVEAEIIEAVFHFLKNYVSRGQKFAQLFKEICDQFAVPMQEINQDRQDLRDLSLELTAAEQGISVEKLVEQYQQSQGH